MRQVILDTETTGLDVHEGHRVIEIGCVEVINRRRTSNTWHQYINPERSIERGAEEIHGITSADLVDKPVFKDVSGSFLEFVRGAELIIHNAEFDVGFLNNELSLAGRSEDVGELCEVVDSLLLARRLHPGQRNSLDALCRRYGVDNSARNLHGALLDAQILADVYLAMTGGQGSLGLEEEQSRKDPAHSMGKSGDLSRVKLSVLELTDDDQQSHERILDQLDGASSRGSVWRRLAETS